MKIIDLLNKIANGEEVPKKIRYELEERIYDENDKDYIVSGSDDYYLFHDVLASSNGELMTDRLNDTVEIIEEQEEIDIQSIEELPKILFLGTEKDDIKKVLNDIIDNQNQQLQAVKQLDKKIKEK